VIDLGGRVAVVTGAARGIGQGVAASLAAAGATVHTCDKDPGCDATLDVRDPAALAEWAATVGAPVDVLVNNAGGGFHAAFAELSPNADETLVRENLLSVVWTTRAFLPVLSDGASVVNVTSIEAHRAAPGYALYGAAKAGVTALTASLALELGSRGIRVNALAVDVVETPGVAPLGPPRTPLGRNGTPDDVAGAVLWLASDLSSFVTGSTIHVDGGNHAAGGWHRDSDGAWRT
jgi:NAD(P)-dependent dehydrogenase (short-subunit alcohol dehydrogenase family)